MMDKDVGMKLIVGGVVVGCLLIWAVRKIPYGAPQPEYDIDSSMGASVGGMFIDPNPMNISPHWGEPDPYTGPQVVLPVRYPVRAGHEISTLIEQGYSVLARTTPRDWAWMSRPPSDVMF